MKYTKLNIDGEEIKVEKSRFSFYRKRSLNDLDALKNYYDTGRSAYNYIPKKIRIGDILHDILWTVGVTTLMSIPALALGLTGLYKNFPIGFGLFCYAGIMPAVTAIKIAFEEINLRITCKRNKKVFDENKEKIKNILTKKEEIEKEKQMKKVDNNSSSAQINKSNEVIYPKKEKSQSIISRYEAFKEYEIRNGADSRLFELPAISQIIEDVIEYGDPVVKAEGRSPIYYSTPNEDGTFNICGRMGGHYVTLVYKMEYCNDENPEHFIVLKRYVNKTNFYDNFIEYYGIGYKNIYINKEGNVVEETPEIIMDGVDNPAGLLSQLKEKKLIK